MNHYHWTEKVIVHALRIEKHRHRGKFTDATQELLAFLEKKPFIHDDGEEVYVDAKAVISTIENHPEPTHKEITGIVTQAVVNRMRGPEDSPMSEPDEIKQDSNLFQGMENLTAGEVTIEFAPEMIMIISARGEIRRVHCSAMRLLDNRTGRLNTQAKTLLAIANNIAPTNKKRIHLIRKILREKLGVTDAPFQEDRKPHFKVIDNRSNADDRAKAAATHMSYNDNITPSEEYQFDDEDDAAGDFIRQAGENVNSP